MFGNALTQLSYSNSATSSKILHQSQSSTDPAAVRQIVSDIISSWDAFSIRALNQADGSASSAEAIVKGQQVRVNQVAHSVGRQILSNLRSSAKSVSSLIGMQSNRYKFSNLTEIQLPISLRNMSQGINNRSKAFEADLQIALGAIVSRASAAADLELNQATQSFGLLVNSTQAKLRTI
jgi:hypothetical protein